jgi:hypothetical protein
MNDDDRLLDALSEALTPRPREPSDAEIAALRRAVVRRFAAPRGRPWWQPRAVTLLAAAALCTGTAAAIAGGAVPAPVRILARAVGLPVESPVLVETRAAVGRLRAKLDARDREGVAWALEDLRRRIDALNERDRRMLGEDTATLFLEAEAFATLPKVAPPAPRRSAEQSAEAARSEDDQGDLDDPERPPPALFTAPEDDDDEEAAESKVPDEPLADEDDDVRAEHETERAERAVQDTVERAEHEAERSEREAEHEAERSEREAEHEAEREARRGQREAERAQREAEKAAREAVDRAHAKVHEQTERCEDADERERAVPPPTEPDDDD